MLTVSTTLTAGQTVKFTDLGNFYRILGATNPLTVRTYKNGQVFTEAPNVNAGFAEQYDDFFNEVEIYSATAQTVQIAIRFGSQVYYDQAPVGNVSVTNIPHVIVDSLPSATVNGTFAENRASVSNTNTQILAANANRRYLLIQNNDSAAVLRVSLNGSAATAITGFRIQAGATLEIPNFAVTGAINVMMETATAVANNVEFVEA